jgi:hypothetical protein
MFELFVRRRFLVGDSFICKEVIGAAAGGGDDAENADGLVDRGLN